MTEKKPINLVITDIDNTIADKFDTWGDALDIAMDKLAVLYGRPREDISKDLLAGVPEDKKHISGPYIGKDLRSDIAHAPSLAPKSAEQERELEKILHEWEKNKSKAALYDGVMATINKIKTSGAKLVLYTDSRESVCIPRLAKMGITADMIDKIYAQPDLKDGQVIRKEVKGAAQELRAGLGDKLVLLAPKTHKPDPATMQRILDDMDVKDKSQVVMVGDNIRADGTGAIACGINYAWQKGGTVISEATERCYRTFCQDPNYKLTTQEHLSQMDDSNRPTVVLENGFPDLAKYYHFVSPEKSRADVKTNNAALMKAVMANRQR